ncbi:hypothetical protein ACHWQZ_G011483 [Mnemiopsis leidyi]
MATVKDEAESRPIKCVITGDGASGKTTLALKLQDPDVNIASCGYIPRLCDLFDRKVKLENGQEVDVGIWDTAEDEECSRLIGLYYLHADVFILTYKVTSSIQLDNIRAKWADKVRFIVPEAPIVLVGTHCDRNKDENMEDLLKTVAKDVKASQCIEVSAKQGTNIEELLREAVKLGIEFRERGEPKIGKKSKCHLL